MRNGFQVLTFDYRGAPRALLHTRSVDCLFLGSETGKQQLEETDLAFVARRRLRGLEPPADQRAIGRRGRAQRLPLAARATPLDVDSRSARRLRRRPPRRRRRRRRPGLLRVQLTRSSSPVRAPRRRGRGGLECARRQCAVRRRPADRRVGPLARHRVRTNVLCTVCLLNGWLSGSGNNRN